MGYDTQRRRKSTYWDRETKSAPGWKVLKREVMLAVFQYRELRSILLTNLVYNLLVSPYRDYQFHFLYTITELDFSIISLSVISLRVNRVTLL